jgi:hypothetical protein
MKDSIISFLCTVTILGILAAISVLAYGVYTEIEKDGTIRISFDDETGFPKIEYVPETRETIEMILNQEFVQDGAIRPNSSKQSKYLYNQLDDTAKAIYTKLYQNKENLKTGTYKIEFGNAFEPILSKENGDIELKKQYQSAIEAFLYENPDVFYIDVTKMYINIETITKITGTRYNVYIDAGSDVFYYEDGFYSKEDVEKYENEIEQVKNRIIANLEGKSDYEKIKIVHDYLVDTIEYEEDLNQKNIYNMYGALISNRCVCEGYAKAFQYLMNELGIENTIVIGKGTNNKDKTESHAWNYVKLDENWYAVDVTWDDPILTGGGVLTSKLRYKYFLRGSNTMMSILRVWMKRL